MGTRLAIALCTAATTLALVACAPKPVPQPQPVTGLDPVEDDEAHGRDIAVEPAEPAYVTEPGEARRDLGKAPGGSLRTSSGASVDTSSFHAETGAIVVFYRGHWCKNCRKQLEELQASLDEFTRRGFTVHAISTDSPEDSARLKQKLGLGFELYTDDGGLASSTWKVYSREHDLARPAVFVIAPGGQITYRYVSDTPIDRPSAATLLELAAAARGAEKVD